MKRWMVFAASCLMVACMCMMLSGCQQEEYKPTLKQTSVPASALHKAGTLCVGVNAQAGPLAGQSTTTAEIVGIDVDVASYLGDQLGLKVEIIDVGNDPATALEEKTVDVVLGVSNADADLQAWRSSPYLGAGVALFAPSGQNQVPTIASKPRIAAQDRSTPASRVMTLFGEESLVNCADLEAAFNALSKNSVAYVASDAVVGTYAAYRNGADVHIVAMLQDPIGYCAAVSQSNTALQSALSDALNKMVSGGVMNIIQNKWYGTSIDLSSLPVIKSASTRS